MKKPLLMALLLMPCAAYSQISIQGKGVEIGTTPGPQGPPGCTVGGTCIGITPIYGYTQVTAWGDSLTCGAPYSCPGPGNYPTRLAALSGVSVSNQGVSGETSTQIKNRLVAADCSLKSGLNVIWTGTNNVSAPSTVLADTATMTANVAACGGTYVVLPPLLQDQYLSWAVGTSGGINWQYAANIANQERAIYSDNFLDVRTLLNAKVNLSSSLDVWNYRKDVTPASQRANRAAGTLSADLDASSCSFSMTGAPASVIVTQGTLIIDSENILIQATDGTNVTQCLRGYGSTAATHSSGASVVSVDYEHLSNADGGGYDTVAQALYQWMIAHPVSAISQPTPLPNSLAMSQSVMGSDGQAPLPEPQTREAVYGDSTNAFGGTDAGLTAVGVTETSAFGGYAGEQSTASHGAYLGSYACHGNAGDNNTCIGNRALYSNTTGHDNAADGTSALGNNTTGNYQTAHGSKSLLNHQTGDGNTARGYASLFSDVSGTNNTADGMEVLRDAIDTQESSGIGYHAGTGGGSVQTVLHGVALNFFGSRTGLCSTVPADSSFSRASALGYNACIDRDDMVSIGGKQNVVIKKTGAELSMNYITAPSGSCSGLNGTWVFSQDGHATFCNAGTWVVKI